MANLGDLYEKGDGVRRNYGQALTWYRKPAAMGNERGKRHLANLQARVGRTGSRARSAAARGEDGAGNAGVRAVQPIENSIANSPSADEATAEDGVARPTEEDTRMIQLIDALTL